MTNVLQGKPLDVCERMYPSSACSTSRGSLLLATCAAVNCFAPASNASPAPSEVQVVLLASMHE